MSYHIWQTEESSEDVDSRGLTDNSALFGDQGTRMDPRVGVNASDDQVRVYLATCPSNHH